MYRRIELIEHLSPDEASRIARGIREGLGLPPIETDQVPAFDWKHGLCGVSGPNGEAIFEAWGDMPVPKKRIGKNGRFYFTEKGWERYGRQTIAACQRVGQRYRVLSVKENSVEVMYRDEIQVVVRPLRKRA